MANTSVVYVRIDTDLKNNAESILSQLGISPSSAIQMFYSQVVLNDGLPFVPRLPTTRLRATDSLAREELGMELLRGASSVQQGEANSQDDAASAWEQANAARIARGVERGRAGIARGEYVEGADDAIAWAEGERLAHGN